MKPSKFNAYIPLDNGSDEYLIFNTLTDSRAVVDSKLKAVMEKAGRGEPINGEEITYLEPLLELGIMVDEDVDEDMELEYWFQKIKFDSSFLNITVLTTYACNLRCTYCFEEGINSVASMNQQTCRKVVEWVSEKMDQIRPHVLMLVFFGGEPLLNLKAVYSLSEGIYAETRKRRIELEIHIITNGVFLNEDLIMWLLPYGLKRVKVTLDGDEKVHNLKRPFKDGRGTFQTIFNNLLNIKGKIPITIGGNYDSSNLESIPALLDRLRNAGFNGDIQDIAFKPILERKGQENSKGCEFCSFSNNGGKDFLRLVEETRKRGFRPIEKVAFVPCEANREYSYTIDPLGRIYKCGSLVGMDGLAIGDIEKDDFNGVNARFMAADPWRRCKECLYVPLCGGGCRYSAYVKGGDLKGIACERPYFEKVAMELVKREYLSSP